jgi:hypothetical protein
MLNTRSQRSDKFRERKFMKLIRFEKDKLIEIQTQLYS